MATETEVMAAQAPRLDLGGIRGFDKAGQLKPVQTVVKSLPVVEGVPHNPVLLPDSNVWAAAAPPPAEQPAAAAAP
eukprot:SAG11_NODE_7507_length_1136_cov_1.408872_2_plen_75_part_01